MQLASLYKSDLLMEILLEIHSGFCFQDHQIRSLSDIQKPSSFNTILKILKQNNFRIEDGVDSAKVSSIVSWVESAGHPDK
jgi:hypothetical protein